MANRPISNGAMPTIDNDDTAPPAAAAGGGTHRRRRSRGGRGASAPPPPLEPEQMMHLRNVHDVDVRFDDAELV